MTAPRARPHALTLLAACLTTSLALAQPTEPPLPPAPPPPASLTPEPEPQPAPALTPAPTPAPAPALTPTPTPSPAPVPDPAPGSSLARPSGKSLPWRERAHAPYGILTVTAGVTGRDYWLATGAGEAKRDAEGPAVDGIWLGIQYSLALLPFFSVRVFAQESSFRTDLSTSGALGSYNNYDFGAAPAIGVVFEPNHAPPVMFSLAVPIAVTVSTVEHDPPRDLIEEHWRTGHGFRMGATGSIAVLATRHFGVTGDAGIAWTGVDHRVEYRALDGSGARGQETLKFTSWRRDLSVGLLWML